MRDSTIKTLFGLSLLLTLAAGLALALIDAHIRVPSSPMGIVSYELCAYQNACRQMVEGWTPFQQLMTALSLGVDYLFMLVYPAAIWLALLLLAPKLPARLQRFTIGSAWSAWVAGLTDAAENYCLAQMLLSPGASEYAWPASIFATIKFSFVGFTLVWLILSYLAFVLPQPRTASAAQR